MKQTRNQNQKRRELAAYHEAGHVVIQWFLDDRLPTSATIVETEDYHGMVKRSRSRFAEAYRQRCGLSSGPEGVKMHALAEIDYLIGLAGAAAQKRHDPKSRPVWAQRQTNWHAAHYTNPPHFDVGVDFEMHGLHRMSDLCHQGITKVGRP